MPTTAKIFWRGGSIVVLSPTQYSRFLLFIEKSETIAREIHNEGQVYDLSIEVRLVILEDTAEQWVNFLLPELHTPVLFAACRNCRNEI